LDLGCGTADILDYLPDVNYVGIDISSRYINSAQKRFGARGQFIQGTPQDIQLHLQSDLAMGIGLLHHVDDQTAIEILEFAHRNMAKGARLVTVDPTIVPDQNPVAKWLAARDRGRNVRKPDDLVNLIRRVFPNVEASVHHDMLNIPYTHIVCTAVRS
jgi:SAM-dependent methyltransferase